MWTDPSDAGNAKLKRQDMLKDVLYFYLELGKAYIGL